MTKIIDLNFKNAVYNWMPGINGVGDTNGVRTGNAEGITGSIPTGSGGRGSIGTITADSRTIPALEITDSNNIVGPLYPYADFWFSGSNTIGSTLSTWALRAIVDIPTSGNSNDIALLEIWGGGASRTVPRHFSAGGGFGAYWGVGGNAKVGQPYGVMRLEVQHDTSQTPSTIVRLYADNGTTQSYNGPLTLNSIGSADKIRFGAIYGYANSSAVWRIGELEVWDTRDGDGTFSNTWTSGSGGAYQTGYAGAKRTTTYSIPVQFTTPTDSVSASSTDFSALGYGNYDRWLNLKIPNGTPPRGARGWPIVMLAHGGYWVGGAPTDNPTLLQNRLLNAGYAVAMPRYLLSIVMNSTPPAYGTSDTISGSVTAYGRYPSHIVDYKLAAVRLRDRYAIGGTDVKTNATGYGIDGTRIIAGGWSAGGYVSIAAALSQGLTNDGSSRNLTIAGNTSYYTNESSANYTGTDPAFIGAFGMAPVNDLATIQAWDWTHNLTNAYLFPPYYPLAAPTVQGNAGNSRIATRAFFGLAANAADPSGTTVTNASLTNLALQNVTNPNIKIPVLQIHGGVSDIVVNTTHATDMLAGLPTKVRRFEQQVTPANHDMCSFVYDWPALNAWLDRAVAEADGPWLQRMAVMSA